MMLMGLPGIKSIRIKNNSEKSIKELKITFDGYKGDFVTIKNIKLNDSKQIGISTISAPLKTDLKIFVDENRKYIIKKGLSRNENGLIEVIINKIFEDGTINYEVTDRRE